MNKSVNTRHFLLVALLLGFFILLLVDPENVLSSGRKAIDLCLNVIIPSLFPFFVISRLILNTGAIYTISRLFRPIVKPLFNLPGAAAFPIIAGWFSGYPAGAKYSTDLYKKGILTKNETERLLSFCNNSGPLFIVGAVGTGYFNSPKLGLILLISHLLASFTVGIVQRLLFKENTNSHRNEDTKLNKKIVFSSQMLTDAIIDSITVLLQICGTIIFFAIFVQTLETAGLFSGISKLINLVTKSDITDFIRTFSAGSFEVTYGLYLLSQSVVVPMNIKILMTAFLCGFGGFSVYTQVTGLCTSEIKLKKYFYGKIIHGFIAAIYTALFFINRAIPVMTCSTSLYSSKFSKWILLVYIMLILLVIIYLVRLQFNKRNHKL